MIKGVQLLLLSVATVFPFVVHAVDNEQSFPQAGGRTNAQNYKDMILAICLTNAYKNNAEAAKDIGSSVGALRDWTYYDWEKSPDKVTSLVSKYLARNYFNPIVESEVKGVKFDFLKCLDLYHSKELETLVKQVVINPTHIHRQDAAK